SGTKAHYVVGGDVACLMNIGGLMSRECMDVHTMHIAEVLNFKEGEEKMAIRTSDKRYMDRGKSGLVDRFMRNAISSAQERLKSLRVQSEEGLGNWEDWRTLGEEIRKHTIENLDYHLEQMSNQVIERGGHVFFANTAEEATEYIKE